MYAPRKPSSIGNTICANWLRAILAAKMSALLSAAAHGIPVHTRPQSGFNHFASTARSSFSSSVISVIAVLLRPSS